MQQHFVHSNAYTTCIARYLYVAHTAHYMLGELLVSIAVHVCITHFLTRTMVLQWFCKMASKLNNKCRLQKSECVILCFGASQVMVCLM